MCICSEKYCCTSNVAMQNNKKICFSFIWFASLTLLSVDIVDCVRCIVWCILIAASLMTLMIVSKIIAFGIKHVKPRHSVLYKTNKTLTTYVTLLTVCKTTWCELVLSSSEVIDDIFYCTVTNTCPAIADKTSSRVCRVSFADE